LTTLAVMESDIDIDLQWWRDTSGYGVICKRHREGQNTWMEDFVIGRKGNLRSYQPLSAFNQGLLYREFVKVSDSETALEFVTKFGPLTESGLTPKGERVSLIIYQAI